MYIDIYRYTERETERCIVERYVEREMQRSKVKHLEVITERHILMHTMYLIHFISYLFACADL